MLSHEKGLTVVQLKDLVKDWPEYNCGDKTDVFITTGHNKCMPVVNVCSVGADLLLEASLYTDDNDGT